MRSLLTRITLAAALLLAGFTGAFAQCGTTAPANKFCGNDTGSQALANWKTIPAGALSPINGGTVLGNPTSGLAVPIATTAPVLGIPSTSTGQIGLAGLTSGTAILRAQAAAGSAVSLLPTAAGTLVSTAAAPLTINATTGAISLPGLAGGILSGSGPAFTITPVLGVPTASQGSLGFAGATSGTATITAQATAGTSTITLPNASGTVAVSGTAPLVLSATTGALTCPTCVTSSGGGAITGTAPITVSAAGVVALTTPLALNFGGTNANLTASNGGIIWSNATQMQVLAGTATARQMLQSGATATPAWSTTTWPATTTINRILFSSAANVIGEITTANGGLLNTSSGGVPSITATPVLGVAGTTVGTLGFQNATSGTITLSPVAGALGTVTLSLPAATDTLVGKATTDVFTNKTYNAQGTGNVFQLGGTTINGLATAANYYAATAAVLIAPSIIYPTEVTITYGSTTTVDFDTLINGVVTLTANISTLTLTNVRAGKAGQIRFVQSGAGSFTWPAGGNTIFKYAGGTLPALTLGSTTAVDVLTYSCSSATFCTASLLKDVRNP